MEGSELREVLLVSLDRTELRDLDLDVDVDLDLNKFVFVLDLDLDLDLERRFREASFFIPFRRCSSSCPCSSELSLSLSLPRCCCCCCCCSNDFSSLKLSNETIEDAAVECEDVGMAESFDRDLAIASSVLR